MLTTAYNLDGELTGASCADFTSIARNAYTRLPERVIGRLGNVALHYDSFGRRLHKVAGQTVFYCNGVSHPVADRTKGLTQGHEHHHALAEHSDDSEAVYIFTPAGQTVQIRRGGHVRVGRDHLRSTRAEVSAAGIVAARYGAYGEAIISDGFLRRAFAGYEPDVEIGLYNASLRLYSPEMRCFVSVDPRLQSVSPYPYCAEDPFNRIDPTGAISSATVGAIVGALTLLATIIAVIATYGAAIPAVAATEASTATGAGTVLGASQAGVAAAAAQDSAISGAASLFPTNALGFAKFGAGVGFAAAAARNGAELITKASQGEHISAWQTLKGMVIEPVVASVAGGIGGAIIGPGVIASDSSAGVLGLVPLGSLVASAFSGVVNAAVNGQLKQRSTWASIGISMAEAVGTSVLLLPFMLGGNQIARGLPYDESALWSVMNRAIGRDREPVINYGHISGRHSRFDAHAVLDSTASGEAPRIHGHFGGDGFDDSAVASPGSPPLYVSRSGMSDEAANATDDEFLSNGSVVVEHVIY